MHDRAEMASQLPTWGRALAVSRSAGGAAVPDDIEREFEQRLVECSTLAVRVAYSVLRHREDAEDVAQEAFTKAYRSFTQLRDRDRFRAWLVRMTWRMALDRQRANRRRVRREDEHAVSWGPASAGLSNSAPDEHERRERAEQLWRAIDGLPEKLRVVVVLAGIQGHDVKDVAALLELPEGTVKSRLFAARRQLKEALLWMAGEKSSR